MVIGVWGDSITYGSCDTDGLGWVGRLRKTLSADDYEVYNFGISGDTSVDILKRFSIEAEAIEPDMIVLAVGLNDSKFQNGSETNLVALEQFKQNMRELVLQAQRFTARVHIIGLTNIDDRWRSMKGSRFLSETVTEYDNILKIVSEEAQVPFVSVYGVLNPVSDLADGLHPNAGGYHKMFEVIKSNIRFN